MTRSPSLACLFLGLVPACAGAGSSGPEGGAALLVTLHDYKAGERFELASESHTDRLTYYSHERDDAVRKVQTDEVMSAFLRELERQGLAAHASAGAAPAVASGDVIRWGLEVQGGKRRLHWLVGTGSGAADWQDFQLCRDTFLQLYNATVSYQVVENPSGREFFEEKARAAQDRKPPR